MTDPAVVADLAPTGVLRASINLGNPVLAQGTRDEPAGVTVDLAREIAAAPRRAGLLRLLRRGAQVARGADCGRRGRRFLAIEPARDAEVALHRALRRHRGRVRGSRRIRRSRPPPTWIARASGWA